MNIEQNNRTSPKGTPGKRTRLLSRCGFIACLAVIVAVVWSYSGNWRTDIDGTDIDTAERISIGTVQTQTAMPTDASDVNAGDAVDGTADASARMGGASGSDTASGEQTHSVQPKPAAQETALVITRASDESENGRGPANGRPAPDEFRSRPTKSRFAGKILDYRVVELPPREKGEKPGELREWLIEPEEGYTAHVEEEYRPDGNGELQIVDAKEYVANQVVLTLDGETPFDDFKAELEAKGAVVKPPLMELEKGAKIVAVMLPEVTFDAIETLRDTVAQCNPQLDVETDPIRTIDRVPNDARYSSQWGLPKIQAPEAWNIRTDASSVIVAVIDTGVNYNHQDLSANMWVRNSGASATNFKYGMRASQGIISGNPLDDHGHGTHCAGIIGAVGNNSTGVSGVAWAAKIMACKNLFRTSDGNASGSGSDMILCMEWARTNGAHIVSLSQGGGSYSSSELAAFQRLRSAGIIAVCAAGNNGTDNDTIPHYPSSYSCNNIVAVANTTSSDALRSSSCYGASSVDIAAPGTEILSTYYSSTTAYATMSGTSMAAPFVSGTLALLKAQNPSYTYLQLIQRLYDGGDAVSALSGKCTTGKRLNVYKALSTPQPPSPVPTATKGTYSDHVNVSWPSVSGATHYRVFRATSSSGTKTALGSWQTSTYYNDYGVTVGTTYYYWVCAATSSSGANQSAYGSYDIGYGQQQTGDSWDPGDDTPSGGTTITPTTSRRTHGTHTLSATDKYDFFKISMSAGTTYTFETTGSMDTYGELFSAASTNSSYRVAYNDDGGTNTNFRIAYTPTTSGTHYLRVRAYSVGNSGSYTLVYQRSAASDSWDPGDNTPSGGTLLTPTTTVQTHGPHSLSSDDLYDFFRVSMTAGRKYVFESTGSYDMYGELFKSTSTNAANRVAYNDDGGTDTNFKLEYTPTASQTYYLRVRRYSVGADGSYSLKYSYVQTAQHDLAFCNYAGWSDSAMLTSNTNAMSAATTFQEGQTVWVCFQWAESNLQEVSAPITNWVQIVNNATGAERASCMWVYSWGIHANAYSCVQNGDFRNLEIGSYTARIAINENGYRNHGVAETTYTNNVRTISFTVVARQKTLSSIAISGNVSIPSKDYADYRCIGTYSDGTTGDVSPTWTITSGSSYATVNSSGRVTAGDTTTDREIILRAAFDGKTATKTITIRGSVPPPDPDPEDPEPFPEVVSYPSAPMIVEGVVYINDVLATDRDKMAAFSGEECRGKAQIGANGRVTFGVSVAEAGERISFKVWDASEGDHGTILNCLQTLAGTSDPQGTASSPIRFDAAASDPFGQVTPEPLVPPTIIEASVSIDGEPASSGDILAVFAGETIVGKAPVSFFEQNGNASATCRPVMFFSGRKALTFKLWDADKASILDSSATLTLSAGDVAGTVESPHAIAFFSSNDDPPCPVSLKTGWNLVSFSVLPESPTPANVFAPVSSSVQYVSDVSGNLWGPAIGNNGLSTLRLGAGYWVRSSADNVNWEVNGRGNPDMEIPLAQGWNLVGYTLPRAGHVANVLRTAIASGKVQYITDQSGNVYPGGSLSNMRPGVGYWVRATTAYTLKFDQSGMESAADSLAILSEEGSSPHPFASPATRMGVPTVFSNVSVSLFENPAAYGDYLAVFDRATDEIVSVQPINSEDGTLTFTIMGLSANDTFYFKVWNAASGLVSPEIFTSSSSNDLTIADPNDPVTGLSVAITGLKPSYTVTYDLDGKGNRTGGGALTQTVAFGGDATDPTVAPIAGYTFVDWDIGKRTDIRGSLTIKALYEESYTITYKPGSNGTGSQQTDTKTKDVALTLKGAIFTRTGYTQTGWSTSDGGAKAYNLSASYTANAAVTLYPYWTANTYTVTLDRQGGSGGTASAIATYGAAMPAITVPTRTGYTFGGYYTAKNGGGTQYYTAAGASARTWNKTAATTLYAKWTANTYKVTLDRQSGSGGTASVMVTYGAAMPAITVPTRTGYAFGGYFSSKNGGGTQYYTAAGASARTWNKAAATTLYAYWTEAVPSSVHRFYSKAYKGHFFTISEEEKEDIRLHNKNWKYEGEAYRAFAEEAPGTTALYRFYSKGYRGHFFTVDADEAESVKKNRNWKYEGIAYYVYPSLVAGSVPVYRFWSKGYRHHFYTTNESEKEDIRLHNKNWKYEGVAFYALPALNASAKAKAAPAADSSGESGTGASRAAPAAAWTLAADGTAIAVPGVTAAGDVLVEAREEAPDADELAGDDPATRDSGNPASGDADSLALRLSLPDGAFDAALWSAAEGPVAGEAAEGAFDFALPVSGVWHWLRARDGDGEDAFSVWLRAE